MRNRYFGNQRCDTVYALHRQNTTERFSRYDENAFRATPRQAYNLYILPIPILLAVPTYALAVKNTDTQFHQKEDAAQRLHPLINYLDLYLSISSRILKSCSCSSGVLAERNS